MEMQRLDQQEKQEEQELAQMTEDLGRMAGHQSEPTTPPEYREAISAGFPGFLPRPNRYSPSSLTSPPGMVNRPGRSGSQLASPHGGMFPGRFAFDDQLPARSFPATRRNSDDDEKEEAVRQDPTSHRSTNAYVPVVFYFQCFLLFLHMILNSMVRGPDSKRLVTRLGTFSCTGSKCSKGQLACVQGSKRR